MVFHLLLAAIFPNEVVFLALTRCLLVNWLAVWWTEPKVTLPLVMISWSIPCCLHSSCRDLTLVRLPREGQEFTFHPDLIGVFLPRLILLWAETCLGPETGETTCQPRVYQNLKRFLYWSLSLFPSCKSLNSFFFSSLLPLVLLLKQETDRTGSILKTGLHAGPNCGLWAICPVSMETTYQLENQTPWKGPRAQPRLCRLKEYPNYLCNWIES